MIFCIIVSSAMMNIARIQLRRGELKRAQQQCVTLMRICPENEEAAMMLVRK